LLFLRLFALNKDKKPRIFSSSWKDFSWLSNDLRKGDIWKIPGFLSYRINVLFSLSILIQTRNVGKFSIRGRWPNLYKFGGFDYFPNFRIFSFKFFLIMRVMIIIWDILLAISWCCYIVRIFGFLINLST